MQHYVYLSSVINSGFCAIDIYISEYVSRRRFSTQHQTTQFMHMLLCFHIYELEYSMNSYLQATSSPHFCHLPSFEIISALHISHSSCSGNLWSQLLVAAPRVCVCMQHMNVEWGDNEANLNFLQIPYSSCAHCVECEAFFSIQIFLVQYLRSALNRLFVVTGEK